VVPYVEAKLLADYFHVVRRQVRRTMDGQDRTAVIEQQTIVAAFAPIARWSS
jgi:hypothetical protein